ncbi:cholesterol transporter ABCA5 [Bemisia tabaci]|uniref:cholesterol transporter ABCA5 n=1 Tax=Bemisia tabaci TaxID=7038 RepID=UPI003B28DA87
MTEKKSSIYLSQLKAMIIRNLLLKKREKRKTLAEILLPLYSLSVLIVLKIMVPNPNFPPVTSPRGPPMDLFAHFQQFNNHTVAVAPSTPRIEEFLVSMNKLWIHSSSKKAVNFSFIMFKTKEDLVEAYWNEPTSIPIAIVFENDDPIKGPLDYEIRTNPSYLVTPTTTELYSSPVSCREVGKHWSGNVLPIDTGDNCPANQYYYSGFTAIQTLLDFTKITLDSNSTTVIPKMYLEIFPKAAYTGDWMLAFRVVIPTYMVMALSQFVTYLLILIVGEKEKKIKEGMKIMGLRDSVFWLSWFIIYAVFVSALSVISVVLLFSLNVFQHTSPLLIFLLILLYSFSIIMFSFMLTPLFDKARTAGILGNFVVNMVSLLYFIQVFVKESSSITLWLVSLISSSGFALALDKALVLDLSGKGVSLENLWSDGNGGIPFGGSLIMMALDIVIYGLLAYYLDSVVPSEYGTKRSIFFCLYPSFWCTKPKASKRHIDADSMTYVTTTSEDCDPRDVEPVTREIADREAIKIVNLHKCFTSCKKQDVNAVNGINLSIYEGQITAILGHNGAGKTTLINIITGLTGPSSGTVHVFGHDVRDPHGMACIHRMTGVCPQHDILFDLLTPREHLRFFAAIRGIAPSMIEFEVNKTLQDVNLMEKADVFSKYLSGGQKRKLSVGIAVIGDPKIIILDEPTAGVDPYSRRHMWSLLQSRRQGKVILLTTHFMDEADILADRKAVISKGRLRCCGSSLFLKNKFGIGYHLTLVLDSVAKEGAIANMVSSHVSRAEKARRHGRELSFILPHNAVDHFASLFLEIEGEIKDKKLKLGISSYGVSMTTLEEVFLHLEKDEENDLPMDNLSKKIVRNRAISRSISLQSKASYASLPNNNSELATDINDPTRGAELLALDGVVPVSQKISDAIGIGLDDVTLQQKPRQIIKAMLRLRVLRLLRDLQKLYVTVVVPLILSAIGLYMNKIHSVEIKSKSLHLGKDTYRAAEDLMLFNGTNHSIDGLLNHLDAGHEWYDGNFSSLLDISPHVGAINFDKCCQLHNTSLTLLYNDTAQHSLPSLLNSINNAVYKMVTHKNLNDSIEPINARSFPFQATSKPEGFNSGTTSSAIFLGMIFVLIPISLATDMVYDREIKAKNQLRVNGLSVTVYFGTYFIVLVGLLFIIFSALLVLIFVFDLPSLREPPAFCTLGVLVILYCPASILFSACVSYIFDKTESAQSILPNIATFLGLIPFFLVILLDMFQLGGRLALILHIIFSLFNTMYIPYAIIYFVDRVHLTCRVNSACLYLTVGNYLTTEILVMMVGILIHIPFWFFILLVLDVKKSGGKASGLFRNLLGSKPATTTEVEESPLPEGEHEDEDVKAERAKVAQLLSTKMTDPPVVVVQNLRKEYCTKTDFLTSCMVGMCTGVDVEPEKRGPTTKIAIQNVSMAVDAGEVFGLLGHNGAGKTTTMKIVTAEEHPTRGRVFIGGEQIESNVSDAFRLLGYCPQHDVHWKNITIREHLEVYAAIRGVVEEEIPKVVDAFLTGLQIHEHANKEAQHCSGGTRRKLSFAMAMIGNPCVVLLDEPSTGMDPKSKRFLWDTIIASFKGRRGAILTTQSMEEADALCSRVGIMVRGELRCIGSTQHLKNLYGAGYNLEMKLKHQDGTVEASQQRHEALKQFVDNLFSDAVLDESFVDRLLFSIPQRAVKSLAECFTQLEKAKTELDVEEYSFSQTTLEQVFLKFAQYDQQPEEQ